MTWEKVDLKNRVIKLLASDAKDGEPRNIPICEAFYGILSKIPRTLHKPHVFMFRGKPVGDIRRALQKACKAVGTEYGRFSQNGLVFHDLRHTFNTNMRKAGVAESIIMSIAGRSSWNMFDRYNVVDDDDARQAVDQFAGYLQNVDQTVDQVASNDKK